MTLMHTPKKIICNYTNTKEFIKESVNAFPSSSKIMTLFLVVACFVLAITSFMRHRLPDGIGWTLIGFLLILGVFFFSKERIYRRTIHKYHKQYGTENIQIAITLANIITYQMQKNTMKYAYKHITRIIETDHFLLLCLPKQCIPIHKAHLQNGTIEDVKQQLKENIRLSKKRKVK